MDYPEVIFEDNHLLILNKPSGWLSQADQTGDTCITDWAKDYLREKYNKPGNIFAGLPHRLDRPVSGVMVICKTSKSLERMTKMFAEKRVSKTYLAIVNEAPPNQYGKLENWLIKDTKKNRTKAMSHPGKKDAKHAELSYELIQGLANGFLLKVLPETGRPHQIRTQLASIGCPILGDLKYGGVKARNKQSIALHSKSIRFVHPVKKEEVIYEANTSTNPIMSKVEINE